MVGRLYLAVDFFAPSLIRPTAAPDDYSHDAKAVCMVLQPMLLEGAAAGIGSPGILEYLSTWTAARLQTDAPVLIGAEIAKLIDSRQLRGIPVPFPPGTRLRVTMEAALPDGGTASFAEERTVGETTPVGAPVVGWDQLAIGAADGWPKFAELSSALPLIDAYADLDGGAEDGPQREAVRRWLIALFGRMAEAENVPAQWNRPGTPWQILWADEIKPRLATHPLADLKDWNAFLIAQVGGQYRAAGFYARLFPAYAALRTPADEGGDLVLQLKPPRFTFAPGKLAGRGELFAGGKNIAGRSYLDALWGELKTRADEGHAAADLEQAVGRYFGFGERLAWPSARLDAAAHASRRFMILRTTHPDATDWFITNGISLTGQVVRFAPLDFNSARTKLTFRALDIAGKTVEAEPGGRPVLTLLAEGLNHVLSAASAVHVDSRIEIAADWKTDYARGGGSRSDRAVYWHTRQAEALPLVPRAIPADLVAAPARAYALPPTLLDAADASTRSAARTDQLPVPQPPRRALVAADLLDGEALQQSFAARLRLPARLEPFALGQDAFSVYVLRLDAVHDAEVAAAAWLGAIVSGGVTRNVEVWIPQKSPNAPVRLTVNAATEKHLAPYPSAGFTEAVLVRYDKVDPGDVADPLTAALANTEPGPATLTDAHGWSVEIVFSTYPGEPFNLLVDASGQNEPRLRNLQLRHSLVTRLAVTSERIVQAVAVTWRPAFPPDQAHTGDLQANYAADTNKLRLRLETFLPDGAHVPLSEPDALLPLPDAKAFKPAMSFPRPFEARGPVDAAGPQAWYWLAYHFDQDKGIDDTTAEALRYRAWTAAGRQHVVSGYMEHQYGHRVPLGPATVALRRAGDIAHPAKVAVRGVLEAERPATAPGHPSGAEPTRRRELLTFIEYKGSRGEYSLVLQRKAVRLALEKHNATNSDPSGRDHSADGGRHGALRRIYQALAELRDCIAAGQAHVVLEEWCFDNRAIVSRHTDVDLGQPPRPIAPSVLKNLVKRASRTYPLVASAVDAPLARVFDALDGPFEAFVAALEAEVPADASDANIDIDPEWAVVHRIPDATLAARAHFARVALSLQRSPGTVADESWADGSFVPLYERKTGDKTEYDEPTEELLRRRAREELKAFLAPPAGAGGASRLWRDMTFVVRDPDADVSAGLILGENEQHMLAPIDPFAPVPGVVDIFYVPHAFVVPAEHPAMSDRQATADFAQWLIELVSTIAAGGRTDDKIALEPQWDMGELVRFRAEAIKLIEGEVKADGVSRPGLVDALEALLQRVEPDDVAGDTPRDRELFRHVTNLLDGVSSLRQDQDWRSVRRAMLKQRPTLFGAAKGIAVGIFNASHPKSAAESFNRDSFSPQLFSITLTKRIIRDADPSDTPLLDRVSETERFDYTRFHGEKGPAGAAYRYFVDVLPEETYDDTFTIRQNRYRDVDPLDFSELGAGRDRSEIASAGDADARSAESVIENEPGLRDIAANVVHYNPAWRFAPVPGVAPADPDDYFLYLLPERRLPPVPRTLPRVYNAAGNLLGRSEIALRDGGTVPDLQAQWKMQAGAIMGGLHEAAIDVGSGDRRQFFGRIDPAAAEGARPRRVAPDAAGWHLLTTYLSHHWFELELQRPEESLQANLDDDVYEVEIELTNGHAAAPAEPPPVAVQPTPLMEWFLWQQKKARGEQVAVPKPVSPGTVIQETRAWLLAAPPNAPHGGKTLLEPFVPQTSELDTPAVSRRKFRITPPIANRGWTVSDVSSAPNPALGGIGSWAAFEIYAPKRSDGAVPGYNEQPAEPLKSVLVRVTILDHPFHVSRVRMRVVRNWKDVGGDAVPDVREAFVLAAKHSHWTSYGREALVVDAARLDELNVPAASGGAIHVRTTGDRRAWLQSWQNGVPACAADIASAFERALRSDFPVAGGGRASMWEHAYMLGEFQVGGTVAQQYADTMPRYGFATVPQQAGSAERSYASTRAILQVTAGRAFVNVLGTIDGAMVDSLEPWFFLTWYDGNRLPVLRVVLPLVVD